MPARHMGDGELEIGRSISGHIMRLLKPQQEEMRALRKQLEELTAENQRLRIDLTRRLDDHEDRINLLSQTKTQNRLVSDTYGLHQDIRRTIDTLVSQDLVHLTTTYLGAGDEREDAVAIGTLARLLLDPDTKVLTNRDLASRLKAAGYPDIDKSELTSVCDKAKDIRKRAEATGHQIRWDFDIHQNAPLDAERQAPFQRCDKAGLADFVVAPGYSADGKTYYRQQVFTVAAPQAERPAPQATSGPANVSPAPEVAADLAVGPRKDSASATGPAGDYTVWLRLSDGSEISHRFFDRLRPALDSADWVVSGTPTRSPSGAYELVTLVLRGGRSESSAMTLSVRPEQPTILMVKGRHQGMMWFLDATLNAFHAREAIHFSVNRQNWSVLTSPDQPAKFL